MKCTPVNLARARQLVGVCVSERSPAVLLRAWKRAAVAARRAGDDELERRLSQVREMFRTLRRRCASCKTCGAPCAWDSVHCNVHKVRLLSVKALRKKITEKSGPLLQARQTTGNSPAV